MVSVDAPAVDDTDGTQQSTPSCTIAAMPRIDDIDALRLGPPKSAMSSSLARLRAYFES
jgi:hypothetical protein